MENNIYKLILDDASAGFWDQNMSKNALYLSSSYKAMFGYEEHELEDIPNAWHNLILPEDEQAVLNNLQLHIESRGQHRFQGEARYRHKDDSIVWVRYAGRVIEWDEHYNPLRMVGSNIDITRQKLAEHELKQTQNLLQETIGMAGTGTWELDLADKKLTLSKLGRELLELPDDFQSTFDSQPSDAFRFFNEEDSYEKLERALHEAITCRKAYALELKISTSKGRVVWMRVTGYPEFENDVCSRVYGTLQDIDNLVSTREQLHMSEQRFRGAFEHSPIGMALVSLTGKWLQVNKNTCDLLGYTRHELMLKTFQEITHPEDIDSDLELLGQLLARQIENYHLEKRYLHKSGYIVWVLLNVSLVRDGAGEPVYFVSQILDITERKHTELALKESEAKYRKIFENVQDVFYQTDIRGIVTEVSPSIEKYSGYKRDEMIGRSVENFYHNRDEYLELLTALKQYGKITDFSALFKTGDTPIHVSINARVMRSEAGMIEGFEGSMRNVNERKKAEDALAERDALFTKLSNEVPGGIYQFRYFPDGRSCFPFSSKGMADLFEVDLEKARDDGSVILHQLYPDDQQGVIDSITQSFRNLTKWEHEARINSPTKGIRWFKGTARPELLEDQSVIWHGYVADITDQKTKEQQLQTTFDLVSEQNNRLINFAYIISHNLRTHSGNFEMLVSLIFDADNEAEELELLQHLKKVSLQLSETIMHLNDVVSIQTSINHQRSKINLFDYIEKTRDILAISSGNKKIDLHNKVSPALEIDYNPAYIESILFNFLSNGIKYKHPERNPVINVCAYTEGPHLVMEISDNGLGIDLEKNGNKLFGMYRTFHHNTDAKGIGLFITKNQVEAMGGKIEVSSKVNVGTTFKVYLIYRQGMRAAREPE